MLGSGFGVRCCICSAFTSWEMWCRRCKAISSMRRSSSSTRRLVVSVMFHRSSLRCLSEGSSFALGFRCSRVSPMPKMSAV